MRYRSRAMAFGIALLCALSSRGFADSDTKATVVHAITPGLDGKICYASDGGGDLFGYDPQRDAKRNLGRIRLQNLSDDATGHRRDRAAGHVVVETIAGQFVCGARPCASARTGQRT